MVTVQGPKGLIVGLTALALLGAAWLALRPAPAVVGGMRSGEETAQGKSDGLPRIDLGRIDAKLGPSGAGNTDVFQFGSSPSRVAARPTAPPVVVAPPTVATGPDAAPTPTPVPALNVKYIGTVADKKGLKVAVLMTTDRKEVLTGKAGDVVANRLRIVTIGLESVDVQDLGSDHVRRIPLRAN